MEVIHKVVFVAFPASGCYSKFCSRCLKINPVIKSAASTASKMTKMQGSPRMTARHADSGVGHRGGCVSSRLGHRVGLQASRTKFSTVKDFGQCCACSRFRNNGLGAPRKLTRFKNCLQMSGGFSQCPPTFQASMDIHVYFLKH